MTDNDKELVERLRSIYRVKLPNYIDDAADRIEAQAAEIERLHISASGLAESRQLAVKDVAELETEIERLHISASGLAESRQLAVKDVAELETEIERLRDDLVKASREIQGYKDALAQVEKQP